ncbi:synaptonemal complex protein 3 isoform X3 [Engystomops pustulosus]|uniref:synaptonemal complex protein 3 isoform X3 n=1 Tax=Engystomops pustulosus TaxID=76066 RepID=UPI003AFA9DCD
MAPGRKPAKSAKVVLNDKVHPYNFVDEEQKVLSGSDEDISEDKNIPLDKHGKKRPASVIMEGNGDDMGGEVQNMLERFGADISKALLAKRKRLEMYTKASLKTSNQKIENVWKTQQDQRQKLSDDYSQQFQVLFQQWEDDMHKAEEQEEKVTVFQACVSRCWKQSYGTRQQVTAAPASSIRKRICSVSNRSFFSRPGSFRTRD